MTKSIETVLVSKLITGILSVLMFSIATNAGDDGSCIVGIDPSIGQPGFNSSVFTMTTYDDGTGEALYAGGAFTLAGGNNASRLAHWDGRTWQEVGGGLTAPAGVPSVRALLIVDEGDHDSLIVGGIFDQAGKTTVDNVAKWDAERAFPSPPHRRPTCERRRTSTSGRSFGTVERASTLGLGGAP